MTCVYGPSSLFRLVPTQDQNTGKRPSAPETEILFVGESDCVSSYTSLVQKIEQDVLLNIARQKLGFELPIFVLLAHKWEMDHPELVLSPYVKEHVQIRDISLQYPLAINYYAYLTDPAAFGFPIGVTTSEILNSPLRNALRITYMEKV